MTVSPQRYGEVDFRSPRAAALKWPCTVPLAVRPTFLRIVYRRTVGPA